MTWLINALAERTSRERWLLALLVLVALPVLVWFALLLPLQEARIDALEARDDAIALNEWVAARAAEMPASAPDATPEPSNPIGATGLEQSLIAAGLRPDVTQLVELDDASVTLRFDDTTFTRLADWITAQAPDWGYRLGRFSIRATDIPGKVSADLTLLPAGS